jgi:Putative Ig domain
MTAGLPVQHAIALSSRHVAHGLFAITVLALSACGGGEEGSSDDASSSAPTGAPTAAGTSNGGSSSGSGDTVTPPAAPPPPATTPPPVTPPPPPAPNQAPTISGSAPTAVTQGTQYSFVPSAADPNGDVLTFSIANRPAWATFSAATGRLEGTPTNDQVGTYASIQISVTDGAETTVLPAFSITVVGTASGSATLSWVPPTQNGDGSPLANLAGYRVYWGTTQGDYPNSVTLSNAGLTSYLVDQLVPATWYFVVTALNSNGVESPFSNVASKTIQ